jgi:hypothetical protein
VDGPASGACEVPARHEPLGGSGYYEMPTEFQIKRYKSALATDQLVMTHYFPHAFLCASRQAPARRIGYGGSGRFRARLMVMKMLDKTEQSDRTPNPNEKPEGCYCSALPKGSGPCLPCYMRWLAAARMQSGLALPQSESAFSSISKEILTGLGTPTHSLGSNSS